MCEYGKSERLAICNLMRVISYTTKGDITAGPDRLRSSYFVIAILIFSPLLAGSFSQQTSSLALAQSLQSPSIGVSFVNTTYRIALSNRSGWLSTGQPAEIMLSGIDFNNTGGPLLFNHPAGIATDGQHLLVTDRDNNRILIWNTIPTSNSPPDLVLGQKNFYANNPGHGLDGLNWPTQISTGGGKVVVADSYNNRILIWNTFPTQNDQPADLALVDQGDQNKLASINWPWGVWTDGTKLIVSSTGNSLVLIWNTFPTQNNQSADIYLTASGKFGTPRTITSDGAHLLVGDHNAKVSSPDVSGTFVWNTFPTENDQPYSYFAAAASAWGAMVGFSWARGVILLGGRTILVGEGLYIFNSFPQNSSVTPDVVSSGAEGTSFSGGDGSDVAVAGTRLFLALYNPNKIVVFNSIPTSQYALPDFVIGAPDLSVNTLDANCFFTNPVPATDGKSLFVASDFDCKLYVYRHLPDRSNAYPDIVYDFRGINFAPWSISLYNGTLALAGKQDVYIWTEAPLDGQLPNIHFSGGIGNATFQDLKGVAQDSKRFYLADEAAGKIYVWNGIPANNSVNPTFVLPSDQPARISSDGEYLVDAATYSNPGGSIRIYDLSKLTAESQPVTLWNQGMFNLPEDAIVTQGHLFVADTVANRVLVWNSITSAMNGSSADVVLGCTGDTSTRRDDPEIGKSSLFWPAGIAFDGSYLWVGEFKFSGRLLRFGVGTVVSSVSRTEFYDIQAGAQAFIASLETNSSTSSLEFSPSTKSINVNSSSPTTSCINTTFPSSLLGGTLAVYMDGSSVTAAVSQGSTDTSVYLTVPSGDHVVRITGTETCSEFTWPILVCILLVSTVLGAIFSIIFKTKAFQKDRRRHEKDLARVKKKAVSWFFNVSLSQARASRNVTSMVKYAISDLTRHYSESSADVCRWTLGLGVHPRKIDLRRSKSQDQPAAHISLISTA
jgi:hypothetical protein